MNVVFYLLLQALFIHRISLNQVTFYSSLFYDNSQLLLLLKYFDWTLLSQVLPGFGLIISKRIPAWAIAVFCLSVAIIC